MAMEHGKQRKRKRAREMHPANRYAEAAPDFGYLASLYPSFAPFVTFTGKAHHAKIDWTDFNATRELTRTLLFHDFGIQWWIPDGQLCPTIPNRANYIHWINDLLTMHPSPWRDATVGTWGIDIGTGANCVYPLLGAAIHGWNFVGTDVTSTALEWAQWNIQQNPHLATLISIRDVKELRCESDMKSDEGRQCGPMPLSAGVFEVGMLGTKAAEVEVVPNINGFSKEVEEHIDQKIDNSSRTNKPLESEESRCLNASGKDMEEHDGPKVDITSTKTLEERDDRKVDINLKMSEPLKYKYSFVMNNSSMDFEEGMEGNVDYGSIIEVDENDEGKVGINVPSKELMEHNEEKIGIDSKSSENQMLDEDCRVEFVDGKSEEFQYADLPVLAGVVGDEEKFDFCMCNPPFFESMKEAGANPRTACGGTSAEMVYPGGEAAFITKIIEDSTMLKNQIHWFTTMVGRKVNVKLLSSELRKKGVQMLRTTEFVQGRTSRWGLAWTFNMQEGNMLSEQAISANKNSHFFMLEGIPRHCKALTVLEGMLNSMGAFQVTCEIDSAQFSLKGIFHEQRDAERLPENVNGYHFILSVFEQAPGTLLIKGILRKEHIKYSGQFSSLFISIEQKLKELFCKRFESKQ